VPNANPRAIELDGKGRPWLVLGSPAKVATLADSQWRTFDVGMYAHSLAVGTDGKVWFNGHFTGRRSRSAAWMRHRRGADPRRAGAPHWLPDRAG
jgi:hypothetical protein